MPLHPPPACVALPLLLLAACGPQTDLGHVVGPGEPDAGAVITEPTSVALVEPPPGALDVPPNLPAVLVRFPGPGTLPQGALSLALATTGEPAAVGEAGVIDCPAGVPGFCVRLPIAVTLQALATYVVTLADGAARADGQAIPSGVIGQFSTAAAADTVAPALLSLAVTPAGPCLGVTFQSDEPATGVVSLVGASSGVTRDVPAGAGTTDFAATVPLAGFAAGEDVQVVVTVADRGGNSVASPAVTVSAPAVLLPLAITEIQANPAGPEPGQEYVELRNLGDAPLDVSGLALEDAKGADGLPEGSVLPGGAYALVVASTYDPASATDTHPASGTLLLRVDTRLGSDGLSNSGERVRVTTADGVVVSSYDYPIAVSATKWAGKSVHRMPEDACDQPAVWSHEPADATPGWGAP